ncbi:MAG: HAD-IA family hydrolase [Treponema sp.]|jgi:putative hydrolase of the HAD superfamily|nr:HAD-IA family hydrolase [Treponema sp.]
MLKYLLLDLDNTLYSCHYGLEDNVLRRIQEFAAAFLGITPEEVQRQRMVAEKQYGTYLEWLMTEEGFTDVEAYFAAVHPPGEVDPLTPDSELRAFLAGISVPKAILTNSPREHADMVLSKLGLSDIFTHVFDIRQCGFLGKPRREFFDHALRTLNVNIEEVLFIDDYPSYVEGFVALGGRGLLLDEDDVHANGTLPRIRELREITRYIS